MIIDFHNHYYPPDRTQRGQAGRGEVSASITTVKASPSCIIPVTTTLVPGYRDSDFREQVLADHGVDVQLLTFTTPGVHFEDPGTAVMTFFRPRA